MTGVDGIIINTFYTIPINKMYKLPNNETMQIFVYINISV